MWILVSAFALAVFAVLFGGWRRRRKSLLPVAPLVDPDAPCPACGHRNGTLKFLPALRLIVHTCDICGAAWGEKTVVDTSAWLKSA